MRESWTFGFDPNRPVLVYGLGGSGQAVVEALTDAGLMVWVWDDGDTALPLELSSRPLVLRRSPQGGDWNDLQAVVKAPGISMQSALMQSAQAAGVPVVSDIDLLWRREQGSGARWLCITGTNGKSTTTALIGHVLRQVGKERGFAVAVGGNIGTPALKLPSLPAGGCYVLELSSYQLEMQRELQADGAIFLNLTPDHLERHGTMETYRDTKGKVFEQAKPDAVKVLGIDQPILHDWAGGKGAITVTIQGLDADYAARDGAIWRGAEKLLELDQYPNLPGPHNAQNMACALALLVPRWVTLREFAAAAKSFQGLPHRMEKVGTLAGIAFINDSKATNGDSAVVALKSYPVIYWICGGKPKSDGLGACIEALQFVRAAFTVGEAGPEFARQINARGVPAFECGTIENAVRQAFASAKTESLQQPVVLLSPAAASLDQFRNYEHRGDVFANSVRTLADQQPNGKPAA